MMFRRSNKRIHFTMSIIARGTHIVAVRVTMVVAVVTVGVMIVVVNRMPPWVHDNWLTTVVHLSLIHI